MDAKLALLKGKKARKIIHNNEWWYVIEDVVQALTDSSQPGEYIDDMKRRDPELSKGWGQIASPLSIPTSDGIQQMECANMEGVFRIIQSIPSGKAEPVKQWLAQGGYERILEIIDPELALTNEWKNRGANEKSDQEMLTDEISQATFGVTPPEYKKLKGLKRENLRDHMNDLELIFTMLGECATTAIHHADDSRGLPKLKSDARSGGTIAGNARKRLEKILKRSVVSEKNYLKEAEGRKIT